MLLIYPIFTYVDPIWIQIPNPAGKSTGTYVCL